MNTDESYINCDNHWLALDHDLSWLDSLLWQRDAYFRANEGIFSFTALVDMLPRAPIDPIDYRPSVYATLLEDMFAHTLDNRLLQSFDVTENLHIFIQYIERVVLLLAMTPCLRPELLDCFRLKDDLGREIVEMGGVPIHKKFKCFLPTGETAAYVLAGNDLRKRALVQAIIHPKHYLFEQGILSLSLIQDNEPPLSSQLILSAKYINRLVKGQDHIPQTDQLSDEGTSQEEK